MMSARYLAIPLAALLLVACGDGRDDLRAYIDRINDRPGRELEPLPEPKEYEVFVYREDGRRDPFAPIQPQREQPSDGLRPNEDRPREPLEAYPLDSLQMVGTITRQGARFALIRDPENIIHRVSVGMYAGQNFGRITAVTPTETRLVEIVPDGFGGWTERPAAIPLAE